MPATTEVRYVCTFGFLPPIRSKTETRKKARSDYPTEGQTSLLFPQRRSVYPFTSNHALSLASADHPAILSTLVFNVRIGIARYTDLGAADGGPHYWDEAWAFYSGSLEGEAGNADGDVSTVYPGVPTFVCPRQPPVNCQSLSISSNSTDGFPLCTASMMFVRTESSQWLAGHLLDPIDQHSMCPDCGQIHPHRTVASTVFVLCLGLFKDETGYRSQTQPLFAAHASQTQAARCGW